MLSSHFSTCQVASSGCRGGLRDCSNFLRKFEGTYGGYILSYTLKAAACMVSAVPMNQSTGQCIQSYVFASLGPGVLKKNWVQLLWETEGPGTVRQVFLFFFLWTSELFQSLYKCLGSLSCYIKNSIPFKYFTEHAVCFSMMPFFI